MREKLFTLTRSQRDDLKRRSKQTAERRISERLQAILLLDAGHNREQVARILHVNPKPSPVGSNATPQREVTRSARFRPAKRGSNRTRHRRATVS